MSKTLYYSLLSKAPDIEEIEKYSLYAGEMNPRIFVKFVEMLFDAYYRISIWEPFAGTSFFASSERSILLDIAESYGIDLISYGLEPNDKRIKIADSTKVWPNCIIDGLLFHPPYYGSYPMSNNGRDISYIQDKNKYMDMLGKVVDNAIRCLRKKGLACVVGRSYRVKREVCRLDLMFLELFLHKGFQLKEVWKSSPDIVLILEKN